MIVQWNTEVSVTSSIIVSDTHFPKNDVLVVDMGLDFLFRFDIENL